MIHIYDDKENVSSIQRQTLQKSQNFQSFGDLPLSRNQNLSNIIRPVNEKENTLKSFRKPFDEPIKEFSSQSKFSEAIKESTLGLSKACVDQITRLGGIITNERKYRTSNMPIPIAEFVNISWNHKWFYSKQFNVKIEMVGYFRLYPEDYQHMPLLKKHKDNHYLIADGDGCLMVLSNDKSSDPTVYIAGGDETLGLYPYNSPILLSKLLATLDPLQSTSSVLLNQIVENGKEFSTPSVSGNKTNISMDSPRIDDLYENDAQDVTDYIKDVMSYLKSREHSHQVINFDYLKKQEAINNSMRFILVDWLLEIHKRLKLFPETMYLCVNILDRFLEKHQVSKEKLQLVGATSLFIASKYEDIYHVDTENLISLCAGIYQREDFLNMESLILSTLDYNLTVVTCWPFIERFIRCADCSENAQLMAYYFSELSFLDEKFLQFESSRIASACIYLAQLMDNVQNPWDKVMKYYSQYEKEDLISCCQLLLEMARKEPKGMNAKYQKSKYKNLAHIVPKLARQIEL